MLSRVHGRKRITSKSCSAAGKAVDEYVQKFGENEILSCNVGIKAQCEPAVEDKKRLRDIFAFEKEKLESLMGVQLPWKL